MTDMNDMLSTTAAKHDENRATARFSCYQCATNPLARRFPVGLGWPSLPEALTESSGLASDGCADCAQRSPAWPDVGSTKPMSIRLRVRVALAPGGR